MSFATPAWILLALLAPVWGLFRFRQLSQGATPFAPAQFRPASRRASPMWMALPLLESLLVALLAIGLAGPHRVDEVAFFGEDGVDMALVLDISATMQAADFEPNRLEVLKQLAADLVRRTPGNRTGVYAFAKHIFTQTPFTTDGLAVIELLDGLAYESVDHARSGGTAIGDALLEATAGLTEIRRPGRDQVIVLVTDGENNDGSEPTLAARLIHSEGIRFYAIGIGQDEPVPVYVNGEPFINNRDEHLTTKLDDAQLIEITDLAGGVYFRADSADVLGQIFDQIATLEQAPLDAETAVIETARAPQVAFAAFFLFALWFGVDGLWLRRPLR